MTIDPAVFVLSLFLTAVTSSWATSMAFIAISRRELAKTMAALEHERMLHKASIVTGTEKTPPPSNQNPDKLTAGRALVMEEGFSFGIHNNGEHLSIRTDPIIDYWPSTGKFRQRRPGIAQGCGNNALRACLRRLKAQTEGRPNA